jgi:hypothetical protein
MPGTNADAATERNGDRSEACSVAGNVVRAYRTARERRLTQIVMKKSLHRVRPDATQEPAALAVVSDVVRFLTVQGESKARSSSSRPARRVISNTPDRRRNRSNP